MNEQQYVIEFGADGRAIVDADELPWLEDRVRSDPGPTRIRLRSDDSDTEGHALAATEVRVLVEDDDTEGHALSLHFPTAQEADAFRRRLVLTGVLAGTVALGAVSGIGLANIASDSSGATGAAAEAGQYVPENMGGTIAGTSAAEAGQYVPENMGGTIAGTSAAEAGQYVPENMGGTIAGTSAADEDDADAPSLGGPTPR